jgi:hypothetical protein
LSVLWGLDTMSSLLLVTLRARLLRMLGEAVARLPKNMVYTQLSELTAAPKSILNFLAKINLGVYF